MKILLVDNHTKNLNAILELLKDHECSVCNKELFTNDIAFPFELVILLGGSGVRSVKNHSEDYKNEIDFIKKTNKKIIGICLGCEIIASAFDCVLSEDTLIHKGVYSIAYGKENINVYEAHRFRVNSVSSDIEVLATSEYGIEMIKHKTKPIFGMQFHPEVGATKGKNILEEIIKII